MRTILSRGLLALYILILLWIVLFKLKFNISSVFDHRHRSLNLIPFAAPSKVNGSVNYGEMIMNCLFFIPFGLLLNVNFKQPGFLSRLTFIFCFSLAVEIIQYVFAIGASDITDVITNTFGGFLGLILYDLSKRYIDYKILDRIINSTGIILFVVFISIHVSHYVMMH
jgi:glycopeptide antibiotics resistance protein